MIRLLTSILIAILVTSSALVSSARALDVASSCCCTEITKTVETTIQNQCACCVPVPGHQIPNKAVQIQIKSANSDLYTAKLFILPTPKQIRAPLLIDRRSAIHLASNKLYLKKRVLLI